LLRLIDSQKNRCYLVTVSFKVLLIRQSLFSHSLIVTHANCSHVGEVFRGVYIYLSLFYI